MSDVVIRIEELSKRYRLGLIGRTALHEDLSRWWARLHGRPDPTMRMDQLQRLEAKKAAAELHDEAEHIWALRNVNLEVNRGEVWGIVGKNGTGKSTLLKILSRVTAPTLGCVKIRGRIASLLEVGTGFHPELTGRENIFLNGAILGMSKSEVRGKFDEIVAFAEMDEFIDTPVKRYSSGMYVRLAFAVAAHLESDILVVDEVLAVGDAEFQAKCLGKMRDVAGHGRTVLFVSHNIVSVRTLCNRGLLLTDGRVEYEGTAARACELYSSKVKRACEVKLSPEGNGLAITSVSVDQQSLLKGDLVVDIEYESPTSLNPPIPGIVLTSATGIPVYGTNPRFHSSGYTRISARRGLARVAVRNLPLHEGNYHLSVWLGDLRGDHLEKRDLLTFAFRPGTRSNRVPNTEIVGHLDWPAEWSHVRWEE